MKLVNETLNEFEIDKLNLLLENKNNLSKDEIKYAYNKLLEAIKEFEQYTNINEHYLNKNNLYNDFILNEGFKSIMAKLMIALTLLTSTPKLSSNTQVDHKKMAQAKEIVQKVFDQSLSINYQAANKIFKKIVSENDPNDVLGGIELTQSINTNFGSGKYELSDKTKQGLDSIINKLKDTDSMFFGVSIVASSDAVGLKPEFAQKLKKMGYSGDNAGLSKLRADKIKEYLLSSGIDSSMIKITTQVSKKKGEQFRFIKANFFLGNIEKQTLTKINKTTFDATIEYANKDKEYLKIEGWWPPLSEFDIEIELYDYIERETKLRYSHYSKNLSNVNTKKHFNQKAKNSKERSEFDMMKKKQTQMTHGKQQAAQANKQKNKKKSGMNIKLKPKKDGTYYANPADFNAPEE